MLFLSRYFSDGLAAPGENKFVVVFIDVATDPILVAYDEKDESQRAAAAALFGGLPIDGQLPVGAGGTFKAGQGDVLSSQILLRGDAADVGMSDLAVARVDSRRRAAGRFGIGAGGRYDSNRHVLPRG